MKVDELSQQQLFTSIPLEARLTVGSTKLKEFIHKQWNYFSAQALDGSEEFDVRVSMNNFRSVYIRFTKSLEFADREENRRFLLKKWHSDSLMAIMAKNYDDTEGET